jgi:hypothetical protein
VIEHKACSDFERRITRYAYASDLTHAERVWVEEQLVAFIRQSLSVVRSGAKAHTDDSIPSCVNTDTIVALGEGRLYGATRERVREHILNCASCRDEYLVWCSLDDAYIGPEVLASSDKSSSSTGKKIANHTAEEPPLANVPDYLIKIAEPIREEYRRLALEHTRYDRRLDSLNHKRYLSQDEKLEQVRLKRLKLRLKDKLELLKKQSELRVRQEKSKRA